MKNKSHKNESGSKQLKRDRWKRLWNEGLIYKTRISLHTKKRINGHFRRQIISLAKTSNKDKNEETFNSKFHKKMKKKLFLGDHGIKKKISNQNKGHFRTDIEKNKKTKIDGYSYETNRTDYRKEVLIYIQNKTNSNFKTLKGNYLFVKIYQRNHIVGYIVMFHFIRFLNYIIYIQIQN
ncbi:hypothetical protein HYD77_02955 [Mycoplasmopsis bovis]|nr:hypothetical protein [Mycoplasmopsis bovis]QQH43627.1 hypothetical protein HYD77_02955 [Mycoplasmopsis bovis]